MFSISFVPKEWLSLISDPYLAKNYTLLHSSNFKILGLFIEKQRRTPSGPPDDPEFEYPFVFLDHNGSTGIPLKTLDFVDVPPQNWKGPVTETSLRIDQYCNGLLCCRRETCHTKMADYRYTRHTYTYNPTTKQYKTLPQSPISNAITDGHCWNEVASVSLAFDPAKFPDLYQVVCVCGDSRKLNEIMLHNFEVYSSKTNSWRVSLAGPFLAPLSSFMGSGVFWNGSLHWIKTGQYNASMYFDIEQDLVKPLPLPTVRSDDKRCFEYLGECRNHLYLIEVLESCPTDYNILEMDTDYSGWNLLYKLDLERIIPEYPEMVLRYKNSNDIVGYQVSVLFIGKAEDKSLMKLVMLVNHTQVISYDLKDMSYKEIYHFEPKTSLRSIRTSWGYGHQYIESFACV